SADSKVEVVIQLSRPLNGKRFRIVVVLKNVYFAVKYRLITHIGESDYKHHQAAELRIADHQQKIPHGRFLCLIHVLNDETELILQSFQLPKPVVIEAGNKLQKTTVIFVEPEINFDSRQSSG
ncbi:MAG: hypothetical protein KC649_07740, partial [Candidatus Omnitrophica bacterium]|nr:hypothetical protein [Candidatus Omnitrophota bacterium]